MKNSKTLLFFMLTLFFFASCKEKGELDITHERYTAEDAAILSKTLNIEEGAQDYTFVFPKYYNSRSLTFDGDLALLGRVMFYDKNLSDDRSISCASCHKQELAFADDVAFSKGVSNRETSRNSLALGSVFNFAEYYGDAAQGRIPFFWDNRATTVQEQSRQTFANEKEMNMPMHKVMERVEEQDFYSILFKEAFGSTDVTEERVLDAVSEFVNSMSAYSSKYDEELDKHYETTYSTFNIENVDFPGFNVAENLGKNLYITKCGNCHGRINGFPGEVAANNGLEMEYTDQGIGEMGNSYENGVFKVPTLRNIALTGPYMHDGSFETLEEVIEHYSTGIKNHQNLSPQLRNGNEAIKFDFSTEEKTALVAFLNTFTDKKMLTDEKYADPFK